MKNIVVLTGAGISQESGIKTFRDSNGLWENHRVEDVASPEGWFRNRALVLDFYNKRRRQLLEVTPNDAHMALANLEKAYNVVVITQNVDDLHERGGSTSVIHLHGELLKARSTALPHLVYDWKKDIHIGDNCEKGHQLRPHIVWFGEEVPLIETAAKHVRQADIVIVVGTSMQVYPAAGLLYEAPRYTQIYFIDPHPAVKAQPNLTVIAQNATTGVRELADRLLQENL